MFFCTFLICPRAVRAFLFEPNCRPGPPPSHSPRNSVPDAPIFVLQGRRGAEIGLRSPIFKFCPNSTILGRIGARDHHHRILREILCRMHRFSSSKDDVGPRWGPGTFLSKMGDFGANWRPGPLPSRSPRDSLPDALVFVLQGRRGAEIGPKLQICFSFCVCSQNFPACYQNFPVGEVLTTKQFGKRFPEKVSTAKHFQKNKF